MNKEELHIVNKTKLNALSRRDFSKKFDDNVMLLPLCGNETFVKVDNGDFEFVKNYSWCLMKSGYAATIIHGKRIYLHKLIWSRISPDYVGIVDHVNLDKLDCVRSNLRECTSSQNLMNKPAQKNGKSMYKGVSFFKAGNNWRMQIKSGPKLVQKYCDTEIEAALKYNEFAKILHGEFAFINVIQNPGHSTLRNV